MASPRQSVLASRHKALGSSLGDWNDMDVPWEYDQDLNLECMAVRKDAGLFDVSGIKKVHLTGPDAVAVADHVCTIDVTRLPLGRAKLGIILDDEAHIVDDCMILHVSPNHLMLLHGSGTAMQQLEQSALGRDLDLRLDDDLHIVSLQGPKSEAFLNKHASFELSALKDMHHRPCTVFGRPCLLSRSGYSNEIGYEIFARADDTLIIWDAIVEHGKGEGILPGSFNCINVHRIESGLCFFPFDMEKSDTPWDVGYGFAVDEDKPGDYRGKAALLAHRGKETATLWSVIVESEQAAAFGDALYDGDRKVGSVTAPCYSPVMKASIALARISKDYAVPGRELHLKGEKISAPAKTGTMPLYSPKKTP